MTTSPCSGHVSWTSTVPTLLQNDISVPVGNDDILCHDVNMQLCYATLNPTPYTLKPTSKHPFLNQNTLNPKP